MKPGVRRARIWPAAASGIGWLGALVAGIVLPASAQPDDRVVSLPPLIVEEKDAPLRWRYLAMPGFEVLSVCDDRAAETFVSRQLRLEELLRMILPERFRVQLGVPEAQILFTGSTGRARSREVVAEMARRAGAMVTADGTVMVPPAHGLNARRVRFLPNIRLADLDTVRVFAIVDDGDNELMQFTFSPERIAFLLSRRAPALPDWFIEGFLGLYGETRFRDDDIVFRLTRWTSTEDSTALAHDADYPRTLLPIEEMFAGRRPTVEPDGAEPESLRLWRAQCALFVRWALEDGTAGRRQALWKWLDRLEQGQGGEMVFQECFGIGFSDARDRLSDFLPQAVRDSGVLAVPKPGRRPRIRFRAATDLEVARIRGDWERLQITYVKRKFPELVGGYVEQARRTVTRLYHRGERDPALLAVIGLTECDAGNPVVGRMYLEPAVKAGVVRPRAYLELTRLRFNEVDVGSKERLFTAAEVRDLLGPLEQARRQPPPLAETYIMMAGIWDRSETPPTAADLGALAEGVRLFPGNAALVIWAIQVHVRNGALEVAAALAESGLRHARDPSVRERLDKIRAELTLASSERPGRKVSGPNPN